MITERRILGVMFTRFSGNQTINVLSTENATIIQADNNSKSRTQNALILHEVREYVIAFNV
jgi:hypothetical protein